MNIHRIFAASLLLVALALAPASARASRDAVQFGSNISVPRDSSVHDAVCFFCSVRVDGTVEGDVVVFFGNVRIAGLARHDVVNFFGSVRAEDNATIGHDLVNFFGVIRLGDNASVGRDMVALFGVAHISDSATIRGDRVVQPWWIFWVPLMGIGLVVVLLVREIRARRRCFMFNGYPFPPPPVP